ncbi:TPA: hypothetical protein NV714_001795 [Escherichia coli]|nr:hypothetical protein [Escherichia coli]
MGIENVLKYTENFQENEKNEILEEILLNEIKKISEITELKNNNNVRTLQHSYYKIAYILINKELDEKYLLDLFDNNKEICVKTFLNLNEYYNTNKNIDCYFINRINNRLNSSQDYQLMTKKDADMKKQEENILGMFCETISLFKEVNETSVLLHLISLNHIKNLNKKTIDKICSTPVEYLIQGKNILKSLYPTVHSDLFDEKKGRLKKSKTLKPFIEKLELSEIMENGIVNNLNNKIRL